MVKEKNRDTTRPHYPTITLEMQNASEHDDRAWISTFHMPHQQPIKGYCLSEQFRNEALK
jgi:hypothetical protein